MISDGKSGPGQPVEGCRLGAGGVHTNAFVVEMSTGSKR